MGEIQTNYSHKIEEKKEYNVGVYSDMYFTQNEGTKQWISWLLQWEWNGRGVNENIQCKLCGLYVIISFLQLRNTFELQNDYPDKQREKVSSNILLLIFFK